MGGWRSVGGALHCWTVLSDLFEHLDGGHVVLLE